MILLIIRYSEIALKGKNRFWFENKLIGNIRLHLKNFNGISVNKIHGRIIVKAEDDLELIKLTLMNIPGIANFSVADSCTHDLEEIIKTSIIKINSSVKENPSKELSFKVEAKRSEKAFPLNSMELSAKVGESVLNEIEGLKVNLFDPDIKLGIEIWQKNRSVVFLEKIQGQGGLPVGVSGRVISFLSGGIDSPVASWFMMKRGCEIVYISFFSYPFTGEQSKEKVIDLVKHLSRYQPSSRLIIIPFTDIQKAIKENCLEKNRTLLYRRLMNMIANSFIRELKAKAFVTGEAVGQVASQTLENLYITEESARLPVIRPLVGMDKVDIINFAKKIGTYPISIQPFLDCCTVFQPKNPETRGNISKVLKDESSFDFTELIEEAISKAENHYFESKLHEKFWE